jgi:hypothetical protein
MYVRDTVNEGQRQKMEEALLNSEEAMELYLLAMNQLEQELPHLDDEAAFTERILREVYEDKPVQTPPIPTRTVRQRRWYEHPLFHYTVAASITCILLVSGAFDSLLNEPKALLNQPSGSITNSIIEHAFSWLDALKK